MSKKLKQNNVTHQAVQLEYIPFCVCVGVCIHKTAHDLMTLRRDFLCDLAGGGLGIPEKLKVKSRTLHYSYSSY